MEKDNTRREKLASEIKNARELSGQSQQAIADKAGVDVVTISRFERAKFGVNSDVLLKIVDAIGVDMIINKTKI